MIPADRLSIVVVDSEAWQHKSRYYAGIDVPLATLDVWHPLDGQVLETVVRSKQPQIVDESNVASILARSPRLKDGIAAGLRTWMDVPVILEQTVVAVMRFMSSTPNAYDGRDQAVAELIAAQDCGGGGQRAVDRVAAGHAGRTGAVQRGIGAVCLCGVARPAGAAADGGQLRWAAGAALPGAA